MDDRAHRTTGATDGGTDVRELRARLEEAEQTLEAIRNGEVDAVVVGGPSGQLVYTLENADRPYRALVEQMQEGAITLGSDRTILYCNARFAALVGRQREEILGGPIDPFFSKADCARFATLIERSDELLRAEEFMLRASGHADVPVNISVVELKVDEDLTRVVCGVVTDLSHNRRRSEELQSANARLEREVDERRRVEDSLRLALDAAGMGNWELDLVTGEARRSLRHDQIFGHDDGIPSWHLADAIAHFVNEDRDAVRKAFADAMQIGSLDFEHRIVRANDRAVRWVNVQGKTYFEGAVATRMAGVVSDVTERRTVEEQLRQSQKMEAVGQLTGGIAHDFNNLLMVIGGSLDLLGRRVTDDRMARLVASAKSGVTRGAKLNSQLLAFSRRQDLRTEVLSINDLVPTFEDLLRRAVGETVAFSIHRPATLWLCETDPHQLETAILNLAINARDAMLAGGTLTLETANRHVDGPVAVRAGANEGDYVTVCVRDTGGGMTPDVVAHAFEPFFTTKEVGKGTGLGLSQVYGFAKQSNGFVTIESEVGVGTAVVIHLPRSHEAPTAPETSEPAPGILEANGEVILLVEDDDDVRATAAAMLRDLGYEIREAETARDALRLLASGEVVDLVFTDVIMPLGMSGVELARELRQRDDATRVLLTSGYTAQSVVPIELAHQLHVLRKPYTQQELSSAVRAALRG